MQMFKFALRFPPEISIAVIKRRIKVAHNSLALFDDGTAGELIVKRLSRSSDKRVKLMKCHLDKWVTLKKKNTDTICQNSEVHVFTDSILCSDDTH